MKKTFNQLTVGDQIFSVYLTNMEYRTETVIAVDSTTIKYAYNTYADRTGNTTQRQPQYYLFTQEADVIRFCKARLMKNLFDKVATAKAAIQDIKDFRHKHHELLNHKWTEESINALEKELAY